MDTAPPVALVWEAPAGCPSAAAVLAEVQRMVDSATAHRVRARAEVTQVASQRWTVQLVTEVDGVAGERAIDADSCASLARATALILAWAVDPSRPLQVPPPAGPNIAPVPPAPSTSPAPRSPRDVAILFQASGALDVGTLPSADPGAEIGVGALFGPIRIEAAAVDWLTQDATRSVNGAVEGAHLHSYEAGVRGCLRGRFASWELDPCLGTAIVFAESSGFAAPSAAFVPYEISRIWGALDLAGLGAYRLSAALSLRATLGARLPLARPAFVVDTGAQGELFLHRPAPVALSATLGVEAHFR